MFQTLKLIANKCTLTIPSPSSATYVIFTWLCTNWMSGRSLQQIDIDAACYYKQSKELKRESALACILVLWQTVRNLMGPTEDPTIIQGDVLIDFEQFSTSHQDNLPMIGIILNLQIRLLTVLCEYQKAADIFIQHGYDWPKLRYVDACGL